MGIIGSRLGSDGWPLKDARATRKKKVSPRYSTLKPAHFSHNGARTANTSARLPHGFDEGLRCHAKLLPFRNWIGGQGGRGEGLCRSLLV